MPSWTYDDRPKAELPDKCDVQDLIARLMKRIRSQKAKTLGKAGSSALGAKNQNGEKKNTLKMKSASNSENLPKFSLSEGTAQVFETLTACVVALNLEQQNMFESKRDAQKKLAIAVNELNVFKKHKVEIPSEVQMELYGIESWAQYYLDNDRQGPKVDYWVRGAFECLYYDWMILTGTEPVFRAARGDNKKTVGQAGIFISEAWALMFPKPRHVLPPRTMRDWADDLKAGEISADPKQGRLNALAYLPTE